MSLNFEEINKIIQEIKSRPRKTIKILLVCILLGVIILFVQGYITEKGRQSAQKTAKETPASSQTHGNQSPIINAGPNSHVKIAYSNEGKISDNSERMPNLVVKPIVFKPYAPSPPQVPGQYKAEIVIALVLKNNKIANNIRVKFDIEDGTDRKVNSEDWDVIAKQKPLILSMVYPDAKSVSWTPDIPNGIKEIARNREKPFILRILVTWENMQGDCYKLMSYSELRYNENMDSYYFDERENKYL